MPATAWTVLGMLAFGEGLSGYDLKSWADRSLNYFYWSPSFSQVYSELKKLEGHGLVESSQEEGEARGRRVYTITPAGISAVRAWSQNAELDKPVLKHPPMVRLWLGHLNEPERLKEMVRAHIAECESKRDSAREYAESVAKEPAWAFAAVAMRWSARYYEAERALAEELIGEIEEAAAILSGIPAAVDGGVAQQLEPGLWSRHRDGTGN